MYIYYVYIYIYIYCLLTPNIESSQVKTYIYIYIYIKTNAVPGAFVASGKQTCRLPATPAGRHPAFALCEPEWQPQSPSATGDMVSCSCALARTRRERPKDLIAAKRDHSPGGSRLPRASGSLSQTGRGTERASRRAKGHPSLSDDLIISAADGVVQKLMIFCIYVFGSTFWTMRSQPELRRLGGAPAGAPAGRRPCAGSWPRCLWRRPPSSASSRSRG